MRFISDAQRKAVMAQLSLAKANRILLYHGTQKKYVPMIMKEGLKINAMSNEIKPKQISLTPDIGTAYMHAKLGPEKLKYKMVSGKYPYSKMKTEPVVLQIKMLRKDIPVDTQQQIEDELEYISPRKHIYEVVFHKDIKPQNIKVVDVSHIRKSKLYRRKAEFFTPTEEEVSTSFRKIINGNYWS